MLECLDLSLTARRIKKMCVKAVAHYYHALRFVPNIYKTQKMCNKAVGTYPNDPDHDQYMTQEMFPKNLLC